LWERKTDRPAVTRKIIRQRSRTAEMLDICCVVHEYIDTYMQCKYTHTHIFLEKERYMRSREEDAL
jgi:hypothetical protein